MAKGMIWYSDGGHEWLRVSLSDVQASGYKPSAHSYRSDTHAYLEGDCDAPAYMFRAKLWDGKRESFPQFEDDHRDGLRKDVRELPRFEESGTGERWTK